MVEDYQYGDPCTNCGYSEHFHETHLAHGVSYFNDEKTDGFEVGEFGETVYVECPECNTVLLDKLPVEE